MGVLIIGIVSVVSLIWVMVSSLVAECDAEKRRGIHTSEIREAGAHGAASARLGQAA